MATTFRNLPVSALVLTLSLVLAIGCDTAPPGGGLTNGPPPDAAPSKAGVRSDLPVPEGPEVDEAVGRPAAVVPEGTAPGLDSGDHQTRGLSGSDLGDTGTNAGTGGRGGGRGGLDPAQPQPDAARDTPEADSEVRATPPVIESPSPAGAQGGTQPSGGAINTGTPRSPSSP